MIALLLSVGLPKRSYKLNAVLTALGMICTVIIGALHGHECAGDGCAFCLAATCAHVLLCLCVGIGVARPVIRVLMHTRTARILPIPQRGSLPLGKNSSEPLLPAATPLSMRVMLRI